MDRLALPSHSVTKANSGSATSYKGKGGGQRESSLFFGHTSLCSLQAGRSHNLARGDGWAVQSDSHSGARLPG